MKKSLITLIASFAILVGLSVFSFGFYQEYTNKALIEEESKLAEKEFINVLKQAEESINETPKVDEPITQSNNIALQATKPEASFNSTYKGLLKIPGLGQQAVKEGVDLNTIKYAMGHYPQTGWPGDKKQIFIVGHNDQILKNAPSLQEGQIVELRTIKGLFKYQIYKKQIVDKNNVEVIDSSQRDKDELVLMTCYPIDYFFSDAPQRYLIYATPLY